MSQEKVGIAIEVVGNAAQDIKKVSGGLNELSNQTDSSGKSADGAAKNYKKFGLDLKDFLLTTVRSRLGLAALAAAGVGAVYDFSKFQRAMVEVGTLTNASTKEVKIMTSQILDLSKKSPESLDNLTQGLYDLISSGVDASKAMGVLETATKLATAGASSTSAVVDGLTSVLNAYSLNAEESGRVSDIFFSAVKRGKTTVEELSSSIGNVAPSAKALNVSMEELFASIATLTLGGKNTAEATTQIRAALNALIAPSEQAKKVANELGIEFNANAVKTKGLTAVLEDVIKKTGGNEEAMQRLFGSVEALSAVISLSTNDFKVQKSVMDSVENSTGSTEEAYKKMASTISEQSKITKNNLLAMVRGFFTSIEPMLTGTLKAINAVFSKWNEIGKKLDEKQREQDKKTLEQLEETLKKRLEKGSVFGKKVNEIELYSLNARIKTLKEKISEYEQISGKQNETQLTAAQILANEKAAVEKAAREAETEALSAQVQERIETEKKAEKEITIFHAGEYEKRLYSKTSLDADVMAMSNKTRDEDLKDVKEHSAKIQALEKETVEAKIDFSKMSLDEMIEFNQKRLDNEILTAEERKDLETEVRDLEKRKAQEAERRLIEFNRKAIDAGRRASTDFQGALADMADNVIFGPQGVAQSISDNISKALISQGVQQSIAVGLGGFMGGIGGSIVSQGIMGIVGDVFGGSKGRKTVFQLIEENFHNYSDKVNKQIEKIGKKRTRIDDQMDIVEQLIKSKGLLGTVDAENARYLEVQEGITIGEAAQIIQQKAIPVELEKESTIKTKIEDMNLYVNALDFLIGKGLKGVMSKAGELGGFHYEEFVDAHNKPDSDTSISRENLRNEFESKFGAGTLERAIDEVGGAPSNDALRYLKGTIEKKRTEMIDEYGNVINDNSAKLSLDVQAEKLRLQNEINDLIKEIEEAKKTAVSSSSSTTSSSTTNISNSQESIFDYNQLALAISTALSSQSQSQQGGLATVIQIDGQTIAEAIAPYIASTQMNYAQGRI